MTATATAKLTYTGDKAGLETLAEALPAGLIMGTGAKLSIRTPDGFLRLKKGSVIAKGNDGVWRPEEVDHELPDGTVLRQLENGTVTRQAPLFGDTGDAEQHHAEHIVEGKHRLTGQPIASTCKGCPNHKSSNRTAGSCKVAKALGIRSTLKRDDPGCTLNPKAIAL